MSNICPLCNGIKNITATCPSCSHLMRDGGKPEEYLGPYSPYEEQHWETDEKKDQVCIHLLYCPNCGTDYRTEIGCIGEK
ncbi:hypothetical protein GGQ84_000593 [Desulfitispora alkaliphila]|uniref:hypothetical protein n=1 Tax=Desulfitispora alkaliphila TaxID=622674 RepID=UPI003D1F8217